MVAEKLLINTNSDKTLLKLKKNNHTYFFSITANVVNKDRHIKHHPFWNKMMFKNTTHTNRYCYSKLFPIINFDNVC